MDDDLQYDVFLSYSAIDRERCQAIGQRMRTHGLRIWFDEWSNNPGSRFMAKRATALRRSRAMVLAISRYFLESHWPILEASTASFRDPAYEDRRFIPLLLEACDIPEAIRGYKYLEDKQQAEEQYKSLLDACAPLVPEGKPEEEPHIVDLKGEFPSRTDWIVWCLLPLPGGRQLLAGGTGYSVILWDIERRLEIASFKGHQRSVTSIATTSDGDRLVTGSFDGTVRLWSMRSREYLAVLKGHLKAVRSVAISRNNELALSASYDHTIRVWDLKSYDCVATWRGHSEPVSSIALTPNGETAISASDDKTMKIWEIRSGKCLKTLEGHTGGVTSVVLIENGSQALSGSRDKTIRLWDLENDLCKATFEGHHGIISQVAVSPNEQIAVSTSYDKTFKLWKIESGICLDTISGNEAFQSAVFNSEDRLLFVGSNDRTIRSYKLKGKQAIEAATERAKAQRGVRYSNAKVVLLGESGVGKSGLGYRLAENRWVMTDSSHGMQVWPLSLTSASRNVDKEVWLWDLAGQPEYRLVHQLFLDETALAMVLFNPQSEDPFAGLGDWDNALRTALQRDPVKLLVASRIDRGGATITKAKIMRFARDRGFKDYLATSAKLGDGCPELKKALIKHIPWDKLPWTSTSRLFKALRDAIVQLKDEGIVLIRTSELRQRLQLLLVDEGFSEDDLRTVIGLLSGQGLIKRLDFGDFVLVQPELLNNYASALIRSARQHIDGIGCIDERAVLAGKFDFKDMQRLSRSDEEILLRAMVQTFLDQSLCLREDTPSGVQLVFPSQFNREMEIPSYPKTFVSYRFSGHVPTVYTTLVVRLNYSNAFERKELWRNAAEFLTPEGKTVGLVLRKIEDGVGEIRIFFEADVPNDTRVTFIKYVHEHLLKRANDVQREREYECSHCGEAVESRKAIRNRLQSGKPDIVCVHCDARIPLMDLIERKFSEDKFLKRVQELDAQAEINLDNESRELILVGQAFAITGEAGQIYRGYTNSDHGIDGEIEFKDRQGRASGKKVYVQLKSGDSYLYRRREDGREVFSVKNERHLTYWQNHAYPVYLVVRSSDGAIRWMNVTRYLKSQDTPTKQIIFDGEPFTAFTLMKLRNQRLSDGHPDGVTDGKM